jgi:hypothetical protein
LSFFMVVEFFQKYEKPEYYLLDRIKFYIVGNYRIINYNIPF